MFLGVEWRFLKAIRPGERITARAEVLSVRADTPVCSLAASVTNAAGEEVLTGTAVTCTLSLPAPDRHAWVKIPAGPKGRFIWAGPVPQSSSRILRSPLSLDRWLTMLAI